MYIIYKSLNTQTTKHVCCGERLSEKAANLCLMKLNRVKLLESVEDTKELKANKLINKYAITLTLMKRGFLFMIHAFKTIYCEERFSCLF